jgi:hypothetical protein
MDGWNTQILMDVYTTYYLNTITGDMTWDIDSIIEASEGPKPPIPVTQTQSFRADSNFIKKDFGQASISAGLNNKRPRDIVHISGKKMPNIALRRSAPNILSETNRSKAPKDSSVLDIRIIEAADIGDARRLFDLLSTGVNIEVTDKWGWTAMYMASYGRIS